MSIEIDKIGATTATRIEPNDRLREDVSMLGRLVGEVLREQGGDELFAAVEYVRGAAIAERGDGASVGGNGDPLMRWAEAQPTGRLLQLVRAFGVYFHLINLAEQHHRVRTNAHRQRLGAPLHESIAAAVAELQSAGFSIEALRQSARDLRVQPVFTAHPSEARRRTLLHHLEAAARIIERLDAPHLSPRDRESILDSLRTRITLIWQTAETRIERPTVIDEVQSVLHFLAGNIYDVAPRVYRELGWALGEEHPERIDALAPQLLRFGSWVGSDGDGNPGVTSGVTLAASRLMRSVLLRRYREEAQELGRDISVSARLNGATPELLQSLERDRAELGTQPVRQWADEPYRRKLGLIAERLRRADNGEPGGYVNSQALLADLQLIGDSLRQHCGGRIASGQLEDFRLRVEVFGFHLAELEIRRHADRQAEAVAELLALAGVSGYLALDHAGRAALLTDRLVGPSIAPPPEALSPATREFLLTFEAMATIQRMSGPAACQTYIVSMSRAPSDALAALFLAREAGLYNWPGGDAPAESRLDIVPLFETVDELSTCGTILTNLLETPPYRAAVRARGGKQQVMVGYSDSNKDGGYLAANWHIYGAQEQLARAAATVGVELLVFHGRGGAIGRGGGPTGRALMARPPEARLPNVKVTEQGEVINARYGHPAIAERHFEQVIHALMLSELKPHEKDPGPEWIATMERLSETSYAHYEALIKRSPELLEFFRQATPFPELGTLNLASRPVSRSSAKGQISLDDLRAIPWVFSWTQIRANLPGWFGLGTALQAEIEAGGLERMQQMYRGWRFFSTTLDNAQRSLSTADMRATERYSQLINGGERVLGRIRDEYNASVAAMLRVTGQSDLLEDAPVLSRSIKLRNPYVDALHLAQIVLLRRYRALPEDAPAEERATMLDAIHHSINGIAAGVQTTG